MKYIISSLKEMKKEGLKGFTLIEILVVVSIIGVLTTVVLVSLNSAKDKATDVKSVTELDQLRKALELYRTDNGKYPGEENGVYAPGAIGICDLRKDINGALVFDENGAPIRDCTGGENYNGLVSTLFDSELVVKNYISAIPYYVAEVNDFRYLTGTQANYYGCGGQHFSSYLIYFLNPNYDLMMSKIDKEYFNGNCEGDNACYYCFGY